MPRKKRTATSPKKDVAVKAPEPVQEAYAKTMRLEALCHLSGKYNLPYSTGQRFIISKPQADVLIENNDAKPV